MVDLADTRVCGGEEVEVGVCVEECVSKVRCELFVCLQS